MRITIITYLERENDKTHDPVVDQVASALRGGGHSVSILGAHGDVPKLIAGLKRRKPDLVFNLMEMFGKNLLADVAVVGLLELLQYPHTGGGPGEVFIQQDKALTKKLLAFDRVLYPDFAVFSPAAELETGGNLRLPLFVKPLRCDASISIDSGSLVHTTPELMKRVLSIHKSVGDSALAEEYIDGRELYVGILGNDKPLAFPPVEVDFTGLPADRPHILDSKAKWAKGSVEYQGTRSVMADLSEELCARLQKVSLDAYRAVRVRDYGRIDLRLTASNDIYVIEVNASCYLEESSEFAMAAAAAGIEYPDLINRIAELARVRQERERTVCA